MTKKKYIVMETYGNRYGVFDKEEYKKHPLVDASFAGLSRTEARKYARKLNSRKYILRKGFFGSRSIEKVV